MKYNIGLNHLKKVHEYLNTGKKSRVRIDPLVFVRDASVSYAHFQKRMISRS